MASCFKNWARAGYLSENSEKAFSISMPSDDHPNPLQSGLQALGHWWNALPKPHIRLPGQVAEKDSAVASSRSPSETTTSSSGGVISGVEHTSLSYRAEQSPGQSLSGLHVGPVDKDDLGRATWTFLHVLAAQYPDRPTKSQQKDVHALVDVLTRIYPCADCAEHFKGIVRHSPPKVTSGPSLRQWMCEVHNEVNKSLNKPSFNCNIVSSRWGALDCGEELACDLTARRNR